MRYALRLAAVLAAALPEIWACSVPGTGSSTPSPADMSATAVKGLLAADTLNYKGTLQKSGITYTVDLTTDRKGDSHATISSGDASVEVTGGGSDQEVLRAIVDGNLERDLESHFKPAHESSASISGSAARKLSGTQPQRLA